MARPRKYDREEITKKLNEYIDNEEIPILAEFCYKNGIIRQYLYEMAQTDEGLSDAIKRCIEKKEAQLEKLALLGTVNTTMAVFSLKQLGWRDKVDNKVTLNLDELTDEEIEELLGE